MIDKIIVSLFSFSLGCILILVILKNIKQDKDSIQETVRATVVLNEARLEKRYFDLEERNNNLENRIFNLECPRVKGCIKK